MTKVVHVVYSLHSITVLDHFELVQTAPVHYVQNLILLVVFVHTLYIFWDVPGCCVYDISACN